MASLISGILGLPASAFIALQAPANAELSRGLGLPVSAAAASVVSGAVVLAVTSALPVQLQGEITLARSAGKALPIAGAALIRVR